MQSLLVIVGLFIWFYVWWKTTSEAWKDSRVTGDVMKALACTVILGPIFATIAMIIVVFVGGYFLGVPSGF